MNTTKDDRVFAFTQIVAASVTLALLLAFLALYVFPDHTDADFAWTILPRTSAILIGAGYTAGAYFFGRLILDKKWHRVQAGFLPITAFTILMFAATILHRDRFHHGALTFYLWTIIYAITPILIPFIWWRNQITGVTDLEEHDVRFTPIIRSALKGIGIAGVLVFVIVFITDVGGFQSIEPDDLRFGRWSCRDTDRIRHHSSTTRYVKSANANGKKSNCNCMKKITSGTWIENPVVGLSGSWLLCHVSQIW